MKKYNQFLKHPSSWAVVYLVSIMLVFILISGLGFTSSVAEKTVWPITAGSSSAMLIPFVNNQAVAVQYMDTEHMVELLLANETDVQDSIRILCERGKFCFIPSVSEAPEFLVYDDSEHILAWYEWRENQLSLLRKWDGSYNYIAKAEGLMLISKENIEFVDSRQRTILELARNLSNLYYDDVIWDNKGWILLSREASPTNLRAVRRIRYDWTLQWICELPEIKEVGGFFSDGDDGVWISYSLNYTGAMTICHINGNGVQDRQLFLDGEARVKYLHCAKRDTIIGFARLVYADLITLIHSVR